MLKTAALAIAALFASAAVALACSCLPYRDAAAQLAETDVAFIGVAVKTQRASPGSRDRVTTFRVTETLKGAPARTVRVRHEIGDGGNCGISFPRNTPLLVLAYNYNGQLATSMCSAPRFGEEAYRAAAK